MRLEHQITHPRLLRKPARGDGATAAGLGGEVGGRKTSRFVDATLLDQGRKAAIIQALAERQIGDEVGREIFVGAVEYQLTAFAHHLGRAATGSTKRDRALGAVAEQVQAFSALLGRLPEAARGLLAERLVGDDGSRPDAGQDPLRELGCELDHLERACRLSAETPRPTSTPELELVHQLARAFAACFEETPTEAADGAFATALRLLAEETDLAIPHAPDLLRQALRHRI